MFFSQLHLSFMSKMRTSPRRKVPSSPAKTPSRAPKRARVRKLEDSVASSHGTVKVSLSPAAELRLRELELYSTGSKCVVGCDEAGRGPLAGPVVAAACFVPPEVDVDEAGLSDVHDSKTVSKKAREKMYDLLTTDKRIKWSVSIVSAQEIDEVNILQASMLAMHRATVRLSQGKQGVAPDYVLIDGPRAPWGHSKAIRPNGTVRKADPPMPKSIVHCEPIIKGDGKIFCIAAASIIAKVTRDRIMTDLDQKYPGYQLSQHQGYPVRAHVAAIHSMGGVSPIHRMTFRPIKGSSWKVLKQFTTKTRKNRRK
jgi:ribonuclease HII